MKIRCGNCGQEMDCRGKEGEDILFWPCAYCVIRAYEEGFLDHKNKQEFHMESYENLMAKIVAVNEAGA